MRMEKLGRYYLNGGDAFKMKFFVVRDGEEDKEEIEGVGNAEEGRVDGGIGGNSGENIVGSSKRKEVY